MRDGFLILLIALVGLGVGWWALRKKPTEVAGPQPVFEPVPDEARRLDAHRQAIERSSGSGSSIAELGRDVPNTKVLPHPEDRPLATLEFEGGIGHVAVRRGEVVIGRHSTDDVLVADVRVSRHHARLVARSDGAFEIHNLTAVRSEPNPMLVNGVDREHAKIGDGDVISLGGVSFKFRQAAA